MIRIIVVGAGGLGRELAWLIKRIEGMEVAGFVDDNEELIGSDVNGYPVLGNLDWLIRSDVAYALAIGIGIPRLKRSVVERLRRNAKLSFPPIIAPTALIGDDVEIGEGVVITDGTIVTCNVRLGAFTLLNLNVTIGHDCDLREFVTVSPGTNLSGYTKVGFASDIGTNVTVIPGKTIGDNSVIGASACVTKDIPDSVTAVGIPAKVVGVP